MREDVLLLKKEFKRIKNMGLVKSLRKGPTGIGYTFETLLNKKEDQESKPDFRSIELKCKYAYSKIPLSLFSCAPLKNGNYATRYIFETYGYLNPEISNSELVYYNNVFANYTKDRGGYKFNLEVNRDKKQVIMKACKNGEFVEDVCYWDFETLEKRLLGKLTNLAIVYAYPYYKNNAEYFKYVKMDIYKLKSFDKFLELIENDEVLIHFYIKDGFTDIGTPRLIAREVKFALKLESISKLFEKIT